MATESEKKTFGLSMRGGGQIEHPVRSCGSVAAVLQGAPVTTQDLDLLVRDTPTNRQKIEELGDRLGASAVGPWHELPVVTIVSPTVRHSVLLSSLQTSGQASGRSTE
jgi:hypothetical protein